MDDYVISCLNMDYFDLDHFAELTSEMHSKYPEMTLKLIVYNAKYLEMRIVVLKPSNSWGGLGLVGAEFGTGIQNSLSVCLKNFKAKGEDASNQRALRSEKSSEV